jgi:DNA-binding MarR family transcriptional regulator
VSYNVKKLVENGYLNQERSPHDRRMTRVRVSEKGLELCERIDRLYQNNAAELEREVMGQEQLAAANQVLGALERYWSNYITYSR